MHEEIRDMRCKNCVHMIPTKHLDNGVWRWFYICDLFAHEKNGWAITVTQDDRCEMYMLKINLLNSEDVECARLLTVDEANSVEPRTLLRNEDRWEWWSGTKMDDSEREKLEEECGENVYGVKVFSANGYVMSMSVPPTSCIPAVRPVFVLKRNPYKIGDKIKILGIDCIVITKNLALTRKNEMKDRPSHFDYAGTDDYEQSSIKLDIEEWLGKLREKEKQNDNFQKKV